MVRVTMSPYIISMQFYYIIFLWVNDYIPVQEIVGSVRAKQTKPKLWRNENNPNKPYSLLMLYLGKPLANGVLAFHLRTPLAHHHLHKIKGQHNRTSPKFPSQFSPPKICRMICLIKKLWIILTSLPSTKTNIKILWNF